MATASLLDLVSLATAYQAAVLRDAPEAELTGMRSQAHDHLDCYLDQMDAAAVATRNLLRG